MPDGSQKNRRCRWTPLFVVFVLGMLAAAGIVGVTKATDQAAFCGSCHAMSEAALTHKQSVHAKEDCNSCHLPYPVVSRMPEKAAVGFHDLYVTLTNKVPSNVRASVSMKTIINDNCIRCHSATVSKVNMNVKQYCTDCHKAVPHMNKRPISERRAADV